MFFTRLRNPGEIRFAVRNQPADQIRFPIGIINAVVVAKPLKRMQFRRAAKTIRKIHHHFGLGNEDIVIFRSMVCEIRVLRRKWLHITI